jgi:HTH-type transcriptional regulator, sugar sensing transcriptional regulator
MELERVLREFGLTDTEAKVYLALLKLGESNAAEIVRYVKNYNANVYTALSTLEKKGLVSHIQRNSKRHYIPIDPQRLLDMWDSKRQDIEEVFPMLKKLYGSKKTEREVNVISGVNGIKTYFNDMLRLKKPVISMGSSLQVFPVLQHRLAQFSKRYQKIEEFPSRLIVVDRPEVRSKAGEMQKMFPGLRMRFYREEFFSPVVFTSYGDRLVQAIWEDEPLTIIIKDKCIAKAFQNYFEMLWMISKD